MGSVDGRGVPPDQSRHPRHHAEPESVTERPQRRQLHEQRPDRRLLRRDGRGDGRRPGGARRTGVDRRHGERQRLLRRVDAHAVVRVLARRRAGQRACVVAAARVQHAHAHRAGDGRREAPPGVEDRRPNHRRRDGERFGPADGQ